MALFSEGAKQRLSIVINVGKTVFHYGFIPTVIYLGFTQGSDPGMPEIQLAKYTQVVNEILYLPLITFTFATTVLFFGGVIFIFTNISPKSNFRMIIFGLLFWGTGISFTAFGQTITNQSQKLYVVGTEFPWYVWDKRNTFLFQFFLMNSSKPLLITCYGLISLDNSLILKVVKACYSFLSFLRARSW